MAKKPIFVTLEESTHARMKSAAPMRGLNLQEAYEQALLRWLDGEVQGKPQPVAEILQKQRNVRYNTPQIIQAAQKGRETLTALSQILAEIEEAAGQGADEAGSGNAESKQSIRSTAAQIEDRLGAFTESASELQRRNEAAGIAKQRRDRKLPRGGA